MTDPSLSATELNNRLVPKNLIRLNCEKQDILLLNDVWIREMIIGLFYNINKTSRGFTNKMKRLDLYDNMGIIFSLTFEQQINLYNYILSNKSNGLSRIIHKSLLYSKIKL